MGRSEQRDIIGNSIIVRMEKEMKENVFLELKSLIMEVDEGTESEKIDENTDLIEDLGFDSLQVMKLIVYIEEKFNIEIMDIDFENIAKVSELINLLESERNS